MTEFGAVYRLIDAATSGEFIVMVAHLTKDITSPQSVLLVNTYGPAREYEPGMIANWSVYEGDWERVDDNQ